jgi:hypothetical protein
MVGKSDCITIFNEMIRGAPFNKLILIFSDYLTEIKCEKSDKMINLVVQNPQLINMAMPKIIEYFSRKYCILSIMFNNKTILYYD